MRSPCPVCGAVPPEDASATYQCENGHWVQHRFVESDFGDACLRCGVNYGAHEQPCSCCEGRQDGDHRDLCDLCLSAALAGQYPHGCKRQEAS